MSHSKPRYSLIVTIALGWQLVVYALSVAGIFGDIYALLGIAWNSTGFINVLGTTVGLVLLELPLVVFVVVMLWRHRRREHEKTMA
jgi:hypothetical protein